VTEERTSPPGNEPRIVLTVEEAAQRLRIGRTLMYALVKRGDVESVTIGRLRRIPLDALYRYVASLRPGPIDDRAA
jgi:excisionase family DNA binding protein